jgi:integrase
MPMASVVQLRPSQSEKPTARRGRKPNGAFRSREYLTETEIEALRKAARRNRNPARDELLVVLAFRHALRVSELVGLTVEQFDLKAATVHIRRAKNGTPGIRAARGRAAPDPAADPREWPVQPVSVSQRAQGTPVNRWRPEAH